ncbi:MAG: nucleotidyltransferase family protein [Candidatus Sumerlaeota bacterium]
MDKVLNNMVNLVESKISEIREACKSFGVEELEIFGSARSGKDFDPSNSDVDFLVRFLPREGGTSPDDYFGLKEKLEELIGRPIDLVMVKAIQNKYFLESIQDDREMIYTN